MKYQDEIGLHIFVVGDVKYQDEMVLHILVVGGWGCEVPR